MHAAGLLAAGLLAVGRHSVGRHPAGHADGFLRLPEPQHHQDRGDRDDGGNDVGQFHGEVVGGDELGNGEGNACHQCHGPGLLHAPAPVHDEHEQERHEQRDERGLPSGHRGQVVERQAGDAVERNDRRGHGAEGDGRRVGQQGDHRGLQRFHPGGHQHGRRNCHRGAETGQGFQQGPEAEGDQDRQDAQIVRNGADGAAQGLEPWGGDGELVDPQGVDQDPEYGE
jgi:hypothetical protein